MYNEFSTYIDARKAELDLATTTDLAKLVTLDQNELAEPQKDLSYILKLDAFQEDDTEAPVYIVNGIIELSFDVVSEDTTRYKTIIDSYVFALVKIMRATRFYENVAHTIKFEIGQLKADGLNNFQENGTVYKPRILFEAKYIDYTAAGATPLGAVTLLTPTNNTGSSGNDFTWQTLAGATSYDFELSLSGAVVLSQTNITITAFSVPGSILTTPLALYSWRVRANNAIGAGSWSTQWNFLLL